MMAGNPTTPNASAPDAIEITAEMIAKGREAMESRWLEFTGLSGHRLWDEVLRETFQAMWGARTRYRV
jgi:hypothetical protein